MPVDLSVLQREHRHYFEVLNKPYFHTLQTPKLTVDRRAGNTTRQVDFAIQILFSGNGIVCLDHAHSGHNRKENERLMDLIIKRMVFEHHSRKDDLIVNRRLLTIYLKEDNHA